MPTLSVQARISILNFRGIIYRYFQYQPIERLHFEHAQRSYCKTHMHQTTQLIDSLKSALRAQGLTYRDVAAALELSEASVKRIFAERSFSLQRLEQICSLLDMTIFELARLSAHQDQHTISTLTVEQESALAKEPRLLLCFYLLINGWIPSRIKQRLRMTSTQTTDAITKLHRLRLIERSSRNRIRLLTARTIAWRKGGPVRSLYEQRVKAEFLDADFEATRGLMRFESAELSTSSMKILSRKIEKLMKEFDDLAELDMALPPESKKSVGLLSALRPWVFSLVPD